MNKYKYYLFTVYKVFKHFGIFRGIKLFTNYFKILILVRKRLEKNKFNYTENPGESFEKYLDYKFWLLENMFRAYNLDLDIHKNLKILDIGTGFGYFPFVCKYLGHEADAIDLDNNDMYNSIIKQLDINRYTFMINAFSELPLTSKYDLITGFMICFNNHKTTNLWGINEWEFFINSLRKNNLKNSFILFFSFNLENDNKPFNKELEIFFRKQNFKIKNNDIIMKISENNE